MLRKRIQIKSLMKKILRKNMKKILINFDKKQYEIRAPNGSDKAEIPVYKKAFFLF